MDEAIAVRSQKLESNIDDMFAKVSKVASDFALSLNSFSGVIDDIKSGVNAATDVIVANTDKLKTANNGFGKDVKDFVGQVDRQVANLDEASTKLKEQAGALEKSFAYQKDVLADVVNQVSAQTRLGESSMAQQYKHMKDLAAEVENRMKEIGEVLSGDIDGLYEKAGKLSFEVNALGDRLSKVGADVDKTIQTSIANIEKAHSSMGDCSAALVNTADMTATKIGQVMSDYEKYLSGFKHRCG